MSTSQAEADADGNNREEGSDILGHNLGVGSLLSDATGWLREAVGSPPRRPLNEPEPSLVLLWAGDIGILCAVAGVVLLVSAFAADNGLPPTDVTSGNLDDEGKDNFDTGIIAVEVGKRIPGRSVLAVVWLSAIAGGALNIKHVLRSALLCGL